MAAIGKKLTINELKIGMKVKVSQLENILDTCILLLNSELLPDGDVEGELIYFGEGETDEYTQLFLSGKKITPLYFESAEILEGVVYDE